MSEQEMVNYLTVVLLPSLDGLALFLACAFGVASMLALGIFLICSSIDDEKLSQSDRKTKDYTHKVLPSLAYGFMLSVFVTVVTPSERDLQQLARAQEIDSHITIDAKIRVIERHLDKLARVHRHHESDMKEWLERE